MLEALVNFIKGMLMMLFMAIGLYVGAWLFLGFLQIMINIFSFFGSLFFIA